MEKENKTDNEYYTIRHTKPTQSHYDFVNGLTIQEIIEKKIVIYGKVVSWHIEFPYGYISADFQYLIPELKYDIYTDTHKTDANLQYTEGNLVSFKIARTENGNKLYAFSVVMVVN